MSAARFTPSARTAWHTHAAGQTLYITGGHGLHPLGILLGLRWQSGLTGLLAAVAVALAFGYACSWLMAYIGLTVRNSEPIQAAIYMVVFPMTLTSSVFLPTQTMPGWLQAFARHQPVSITIDSMP